MLVNIEGVAQPPHDGIRSIVPYVYTSQAERDIRAAADILDSFADAGEIEYADIRYSPFRDMASKCLVSPRRIAYAFSRAYLRSSKRMEKANG